jgi:hypothetical protein
MFLGWEASHVTGKPLSPSIVPRRSWWSSLRPNARTLHPGTVRGTTPAPAPIGRRYIVLGCVLASLAVGGVIARHSLTKRAARETVRQLVSGRAGLRRTPSGVDERWSAPSLTITIDPSLASATPTARDAIISAFGAWASSGASLPQFSFDTAATPGPAAEDGINRLLLGPITVPGHEHDLAVTISYADASNGTILEADTIFNSAYTWAAMGPPAGPAGPTGKEDDDAAGCQGRYDLQNVATHEAGHFFGLGEDYEDTSTTMYVSSRPCQTSKRALSPPDVSVVSTLYASGPAPAASCGARVARGRETDGAAFAAFCVVACAAARRRRRGNPGRTA